MPQIRISVIGQTFGSLKALADAPDRIYPNGVVKRMILVRCKCGDEYETLFESLRIAGIQSCRNCKPRWIKHGHARKGKLTKEYNTWASMLDRCYNPNNDQFEDYGARGITVCERWHEYANFFEDMGNKPTPKHTIERIDNDGNYCPENCKWDTRKNQNRNKRNNRILTVQGITGCMIELCEHFGISIQTASARLNGMGWSVEDTFLTPIHNPHRSRP